jgi:aminocarboxymuconate-semialdehyde decarboxylase
MVVDVHAHAMDAEFLDWLVLQPGCGPKISGDSQTGYFTPGYGAMDRLVWDLEARLESLKTRGIELQLFGPSPGMMSTLQAAASLELATQVNRSTTRIVDQADGRMLGLVVLPLAEPEEIERHLLGQLSTGRFGGVALPTTAGGTPLDESRFEIVWKLLSRHSLIGFMHPVGGVQRDTLDRWTLNTLVQYPTETTIAVSRLIFAGVLERYPGLKLVLAHGGGTLPYLAGRLDLGFFADSYEANPECRAAITRPPSEYLRGLYFDTLVPGPAQLQMLIGWAGPTQVIFGSDFPYEIGDPEGAYALPTIARQPETTQHLILRNNAMRLLGRL